MTERDSQRSSSPPAFDKMTFLHGQTLQRLHAGQLATDTAASRLARETIPDPSIDPEECEEDLQLLWNNVLASLIEAPDRVGTVANLIFSISQLPPAITASGKQLAVNEGLQRVWDDTPTLGWALRDEWNVDMSEGLDRAARKANADRFVMMNSLIATLMSYDDARFDYRSLTLFTFRSALEYTAEQPQDRRQHPDFRTCHILAAAELVKIAGHIICHWDFELERGPLTGDRGRGGALWDGKHGFCKERWELWRRRFLAVSLEKGMNDEVKARGKAASDAMARLDSQ